MALPLSSKQVVDYLVQHGFSQPVARWMSTNLKSESNGQGALHWTFDLHGIEEMYRQLEPDGCHARGLSAP